jgi:hypothetical protein
MAYQRPRPIDLDLDLDISGDSRLREAWPGASLAGQLDAWRLAESQVAGQWADGGFRPPISQLTFASCKCLISLARRIFRFSHRSENVSPCVSISARLVAVLTTFIGTT